MLTSSFKQLLSMLVLLITLYEAILDEFPHSWNGGQISLSRINIKNKFLNYNWNMKLGN